MARAALAIGAFLALLAASLLGMAAINLRERLSYPAELEIARAGEVVVPAGFPADLRTVINSAPLDQAAFNLLFSHELRAGADGQRLADLRDGLGQLGWRATSAQRNLVYEALLVGDIDEAIRRIDSLLRRDRLRAEIMPVLRQLENRDEVTGVLVKRLELSPNWRAPYFASADHITDAAACASRMRLFASLMQGSAAATRQELKPSLDRCVEIGEYDAALDMASATVSLTRGASLNGDPSFAEYAALNPQDRWHILPGEWEPANRRGLRSSVNPSGQLAIRWDGRGAPLLMRQLVRLGDQRTPELFMAGPDSVALRQLRPEWLCSGQPAIPFRSFGTGELGGSVLYRLERPSPCAHGWLRVFLAPTSGTMSRNLEIAEVALRP